MTEKIISIWRTLNKSDKLSIIHQLESLYEADELEKEIEEEDESTESSAQSNFHYVVQGDICNDKTVSEIKNVLNRKVDIIFTSPPYRAGLEYDSFDDNMPFEQYVQFLKTAFKNCDILLKSGGRLVINIRDIKKDDGYRFPAIVLFHSILSEMNYNYRGQHIWYKGREESSMGWGSFVRSTNPSIVDLYEWILVFEKDGKYSPGKDNLGKTEFVENVLGMWKIRPIKKITGRRKTNIFGHPCPFPVELPRRIIKLYSHVGDVAFDPFGGIASTAVAAVQTGRNSLSLDISKSYCDIGYSRLKNEVGNDMFGCLPTVKKIIIGEK